MSADPGPEVRRTLSIVIPAYNEERFIGTLLERVEAVELPADLAKQVIVVDDCSTDRTAEVAGAMRGVVLERLPRNGGKGAAVRAGLRLATGEYVIVQDADLEYDPADYAGLLPPLLAGQADIVYGSRYMKEPGEAGRPRGGRYPGQSWMAYLGGRSLSLVALACTGKYLTDTVTALKLFRREILSDLALETSGFELDHEITAKVLARGYRIVERPVRYFPRSREEGKKIGARDWMAAARTFLRYRRG
jgi:glycosyltransferase involved in cell wall biosynthesis